MASALVMSPTRHGERREEPPLATPIMRLESIFERTRNASPPSAAAALLRGRNDSGTAELQFSDSRAGDRWRAATRHASPQPHGSSGSASGDGAQGSAGSGASEQSQSPSPEPRADSGSDSCSSGSSYDGSQSPSAASEVGPLPQEGHLAAAARRSPFRGCASMSLDQVPPVPPGSTLGGGYCLAGRCVRSPSPLRRFPAGGPGAAAAALRRRDSSAISTSIVREAAPPTADVPQGGRHGSRARSSSVLRAPSGYSEDDSGSEPDTPSFALSAPSGLTDDDSSGGEFNDGRRRRAGSTAARGPSTTPFRQGRSRAAPGFGSCGGGGRRTSAGPPASDLACEFRYALQLQSERKVEALEAALARIDAVEGAALDELLASRDERAADAAQSDSAATAAAAERRAAMLERLQAAHASKARAGHAAVAEVEQQAAAAAEADRRKETEQRQAAVEAAAGQREAERQRQEAEQRQREAAAAAAAQQLQQQGAAQPAAAPAQQQAAQFGAAAAAYPQAAPAAPSAAETPAVASREADGGRVIAAASALAQQRECAARWAAAEAAAEPYRRDTAVGAQRRKGDKLVTLNVQQIAATQEQVGLKARALAGFLGQQGGVGGGGGAHAALTLANRIVAQCEVQVLRLHAFAFPLAEVAVAVAAAHPDFMPLLLARLNQVCQLTVPALRVYPKGTPVPAHARLQALGYREKEKVGADDQMGDVSQPQLESTDDFLARVQGYVRLYAAITQSATAGNPHGLPHAWAFLARLLNTLPATRLTATALEAFLRVAGFALWRAYRGQFVKLLHLVDQTFLAALQQGNDPDSRAIATRIRAFLHDNQFAESPEGRDMPRFDASSDVSCRA